MIILTFNNGFRHQTNPLNSKSFNLKSKYLKMPKMKSGFFLDYA